MLMMCWLYCIPFVKGVLFGVAPLVFLFSLYVLKRGIRQARPGLRQFAFILMFAALLKLTILDAYLLRGELACAFGRCGDAAAMKMAQGAGLALLALGGFFLFNLYRSFAADRRQRQITPKEARLSFWANLSLVLVIALILWLAAPWVGYLTIGRAPAFFTEMQWQYLAVLNVFALLIGFWKLEDCNRPHKLGDKARRSYEVQVWTAKDTLWVSAALFFIAIAFSYASSDALSASEPRQGSHFQVNFKDISLDAMGGGFARPKR
jgi:hypothetical protein